ncbi:fungal-specific transcription factor domain-containing protein [Morchella snyderi]|nr:fungal-specific transcription factor domain-containing protein [Morchella snyderi]
MAAGEHQTIGQYQQPHELDEKPRGRERDRDGMGEGSGTSGPGGPLSSSTEPQTRKRRRSRKGMEKTFTCPQLGCGRAYSRAEHLYRHQLNHQPKQIYFCDFPDCKRSFVRQDLCTRHRDRHTNRGSQLQRKDSFLNNPVGAAARNILQDRKNSMTSMTQGSSSPESPTTPSISMKAEDSPIMTPNGMHSRGPLDMTASPETSSATLPGSSSSISEASQMNGNQMYAGMNHQNQQVSQANRPTIQTMAGTPNLNGLSLQSPFSATSSSSGNPYSGHPATAAGVSMPMASGAASSPGTFVPSSAFATFSLPQPAYPNLSQSSAPNNGHSGYITSPPTSSSPGDQQGPTGAATTSASDFDIIQYTIPMFGGDGYTRSPNWMANDFASWFFDDPSMGINSQRQASIPSYVENLNAMSPQGYYMTGHDFSGGSFYPSPLPQHPMSVTSLIAPPSPPQESLLSEHRRLELVDRIEQWINVEDLDENLLSLCMMQSYISDYWAHFHPQLPILHRPTFSADKTQSYLLITIIAIGASMMEYKRDPILAEAACTLASKLAVGVRWSIFADQDFRPPAKLWVFQALLLLETFEKMFSSRQLHERAHIHHATTITLMRRGSSLTGRCAYDSPQSGRDVKSNSESGSLIFSGQISGTNTQDENWNRWIVSEATRRAAFAAFVLDSTHATMFGHSAVMVAHEMRLQLPCDETLWAATSFSEVCKIEQSLNQAGVKQTTFLEGLKKTLNGQNVRTNSFGRTILMAGLLSVSWHMHQRDLQVTSLGVATQLGGQVKWRQALTRSFDHWRKDFDAALAGIRTTFEGMDYFIPSTEDIEHENIFESRTVLHHLAHMSMHVDIVDLQIYGGAKRLLGRTITPNDAGMARKRMEAWAPSARARDATFYALRFLSQVMLLEERLDMSFDNEHPGTPGSIKRMAATTGVPIYNARDDHLLNRPWVLYYACLVVWSYGFALEGVLKAPTRLPTTSQEKYADMRAYLNRVATVPSPEGLTEVRDKNATLGLVMTLQEMFHNSGWELLDEASRLLQQCIRILVGEVPQK